MGIKAHSSTRAQAYNPRNKNVVLMHSLWVFCDNSGRVQQTVSQKGQCGNVLVSASRVRSLSRILLCCYFDNP